MSASGPGGAPATAAHRTTFPTMGTVASLLVAGTGQGLFAEAARALPATFERWEAEFSRYRPSSPATAIAEGRLRLQDSSEFHRETYARAIEWRNRTGGAFDPHQPDGSIDLAGIVKAAATEEAGSLLETLGCSDWCLNVGGDVLTAGSQDARPWTVGITDPDDRSRLWHSVSLDQAERAVATSGTSERGEHIWRLGNGVPVRQCSVTAADIVTADVLATAVVAGGRQMAEQAAAGWDVRLSVAFADGTSLHL